MTNKRSRSLFSLSALILACGTTFAANSITIGTVVEDPPTIRSLGVSLPIQSGDDNYNATVSVSYRIQGTDTWRDALPLFRVRPEYLSTEDISPFPIGEQFAGSILDLQPDTSYEIRLQVQDPDGVKGDATQNLVVRTRNIPKSTPDVPRIVAVSSSSALKQALSNAQAGDVISIANGTYNGAVGISRSGTAANPIIISGESVRGVVINASGADAGISITGSHVYVEDLTVRGSHWGMQVPANADDIVIRRCHILEIDRGIDGTRHVHTNFTIYDNVLEGRVAWPDTSDATWDVEGIAVTGSGHAVFHNTVSGFGDSLGLSRFTDIPNRAIDFHNNLVLWGGDDGIEADFGERNIRVFRNCVNNTHSGISVQPMWGGPGYIHRNIIYNAEASPFKLKNETSGFLIYHNTSVKGQIAWEHYSDRVANFTMNNNLVVGIMEPAHSSSEMVEHEMDYNGWYPDGGFRFGDLQVDNFSQLRNQTPYEHNGVLLKEPIFETNVPIPAQFDDFMVNPIDITLHSKSNGVDAGRSLANINEDFTGVAPDLGARERGTSAPDYGARNGVAVKVPRKLGAIH